MHTSLTPLLACLSAPGYYCQADVNPEELADVRVKYLSPVFKVDEAEHAALIEQARQVDTHLKGGSSGLQLNELPEVGEDEA